MGTSCSTCSLSCSSSGSWSWDSRLIKLDLCLCLWVSFVADPQAGTLNDNYLMRMTLGEGSWNSAGQQSCTESAKPLSLNSNWRWIDQAGSTENCYTDSEWDTTVCPAGETCAKNCAVGAVPEADWLMEHVCEAILRGYLMQSGKKKFNVLWCCFAIVNVLREAFLTISASCIHRQLC